HLSVHSPRLLPHVLSLPPGAVAALALRPRAAARARGRNRGGDAAARGASGGAREMSLSSATLGSRPRGGAILATVLIAAAIVLALICFAMKLDIIQRSQTMRALMLFALLLALMATGMPISIALGLSVLTYLSILSSVDPKMVGLKLFTSIDRFEIMAIPFFILSGSFLTSGGVARRMIAFASAMIGHWYGGLGLAGVV